MVRVASVCGGNMFPYEFLNFLVPFVVIALLLLGIGFRISCRKCGSMTTETEVRSRLAAGTNMGGVLLMDPFYIHYRIRRCLHCGHERPVGRSWVGDYEKGPMGKLDDQNSAPHRPRALEWVDGP